MTNEEFQKLVIDKLSAIDTIQEQLKEHGELLRIILHRQEEQGARLTAVEEKLDCVMGEYKRVDNKTDAFIVDVINLKQRL